MFDAVNDMSETVRAVLFRNVELSSRVSVLERANSQLESERLSLLSAKSRLEDENSGLLLSIAKLHKLLLSYESPQQDSHNSSVPPSKESLKAQAMRRTRSLRTPSNRHTGGQPGHKGSTLPMSDSPDETIVHVPQFCTACGKSLEDIPGEVYETRQSIDIPLPVCQIISNHVGMEKKCTCGHCNRGTFPDYVKPGVSYGVNIHALVAYLSTVQHIPFERLVNTLNDLYGLKISQGSVSNILNRMRKQSTPPIKRSMV